MSEHDEQAALFEWAQIEVNRGVEPLRWLFAIPNGGQRAKRTAAMLKAEGVKAGVLDVMLPYPAGAYAGLFIEMKYGANKLSEEQRAWSEWLNQVGYYATVCNDWSSAKAVIEWYLSLANEEEVLE